MILILMLCGEPTTILILDTAVTYAPYSAEALMRLAISTGIYDFNKVPLDTTLGGVCS